MVKFCKGSDNIVANILSRYAPQEQQEDYEAVEDEIKVLNIQYTAMPEVVNLLKNLA